MRQKVKNNIVGILNTLRKAHEQILLMFRKNRPADAQKLLGDCQECAQQIGETIERIEGTGTRAVSVLESYCEQLYQMSQCKNRKEQADWKEKMDKSLEQTELEVRDVLSTAPLKVVFMPYKASMWDCLESIWEAADADPECEAFVVPIPYFERDEKGGAKKLCYEGEMFPSYVPVMPYNAFSLEAEQPDVIYIHNPYDDGNYVTSVHPDFYSANLKKYTDMLVYIPYFFSGNGPMPETHLNLPVYQTADRIIVQDEEKAESLAQYVPKEKIVVLGSPKVDRLLKLEKKRDEIIEEGIAPEWREKIRGKKVILYNVSVTGILHNSKVAMDKIRYVLSCFEGREDVVLWWRPHPLIEATLQSMRVDMYEAYMRIKREFVRKGYGILDETGDAGIAAVVADAYLGENSSSLVHYFGVLGKPILFTAWNVLEDMKKERDQLYFITFYREGSALYFVPGNKGLAHELYRLDLDRQELRKILTFPGSLADGEFCYCGIRKIRNKIILVPHNTEDIYIYDMDKKQASKIVLSESADRQFLFDKTVEYEDKLFFLPKNYPAIVRLDLETGEVYEYKECVREFLPEGKETRMFTWAYYVKDSLVYMASCNNSRMLIFDLKNGSYTVRKIGDYSYGYGHMTYDGEDFWLGAIGSNRVVRWNENTGKTEEYAYPVEPDQPLEVVYSQILSWKEKIIICHGHNIALSVIDKRTGECKAYDEAEEILSQMKQESVISWGGFAAAGFLEDGTAYLFNRRNCTIYTWNLVTDQWKGFPCRMSKEELWQTERRQMEKYFLRRMVPYCFYEQDVTIPQFIDYLRGNQMDVFAQSYPCYGGQEQNISIGMAIHEYIRNLL